MKQFYAPYTEWEDYRNGMYSLDRAPDEAELINNAVLMLSDTLLFYDTCKALIKAWKVATPVNLTNRQCNRKAWIGQAACNFRYGATETHTRAAWARLTRQQRIAADGIAIKIIKHFELTHGREDQDLRFHVGTAVL